MNVQNHSERLLADHRAMSELRDASTILTFETSGNPPDRYQVGFRGTGLQRRPDTGIVEHQDLHQCEIRLTLSYPTHPPDIHWETPLFHPNVAFGGFLRLADIGLVWSPDLTLDALCERLWDIARFAYYDLEHAANHSAKAWMEDHADMVLPVDTRPLRDRRPAANRNVIRYQRRGAAREVPPAAEATSEVLYIGEDTPVPELPRRSGSQSDDGDIFYIGDE